MSIAERPAGVAIAGGELPVILLPTNCPGCGVGLEPERMRAHNYVCECGHHFCLGADVWIPILADDGSFVERWGDVRSHDLLKWTVPKRYEAVVDELLAEGLNE